MTETFGQTIRRLRLKQRLGLNEVARRIGISKTYLSRLEHDFERLPSPDTLLKIEKTLGIGHDLLFCRFGVLHPDILRTYQQNPEAVLLYARTIFIPYETTQ